jgi:hypothetical protein
MARRKKELLELLHSQKKSESHLPRKEVPVATPAPSVPSQTQPPRSSSPRASFPKGLWLIPGSFLLLVILWALGRELALQAGGDSEDSSFPVAEATSDSSPPPSSVKAPPIHEVAAAPVVAVPFAILAITYGETKKDLAIRTAVQLKELGFSSVVALATPSPSNPKHFEIWIGEQKSAEALKALLKRVQQTELPDRKGTKPFQTAYISRRTRYTP